MRETRSSGSVEGVVRDHDSYSDWIYSLLRQRDSQAGARTAARIRFAYR
jgi:hypothetical protein